MGTVIHIYHLRNAEIFYKLFGFINKNYYLYGVGSATRKVELSPRGFIS